MSIVNVRVDGRLIHGQVARLWTNTLEATRIMVIGETIADDEVEKSALVLARPAGVKLSILPPEKATKNILEGRYDKQRVFIVTREPQVLLDLVQAGVKLDSINVGNLPAGNGRITLFKSVGVDQAEAAIFRQLDHEGVKLYHQMVPNDPQSTFMDVLNEKVGE